MTPSGVFLSVEGVDASGKSTNIPYIAQHLRNAGYLVTTTREPGGSVVGEQLRTIVLSNYMPLLTEALLFAAARADHIETLIKPAMAQGHVVITDRFADSTYAYQGSGRGIPLVVERLEEMVLQGFQPETTLFFDASFEVSTQRLGLRKGQSDRFDQEHEKFRRLVYEGYQLRFKQNPYRMHRIDANVDLGGVQAQLDKWIYNTFIPKHPELRNLTIPKE